MCENKSNFTNLRCDVSEVYLGDQIFQIQFRLYNWDNRNTTMSDGT